MWVDWHTIRENNVSELIVLTGNENGTNFQGVFSQWENTLTSLVKYYRVTMEQIEAPDKMNHAIVRSL
jgi:redox-regulated HSP33 family molecular chaperone